MRPAMQNIHFTLCPPQNGYISSVNKNIPNILSADLEKCSAKTVCRKTDHNKLFSLLAIDWYFSLQTTFSKVSHVTLGPASNQIYNSKVISIDKAKAGTHTQNPGVPFSGCRLPLAVSGISPPSVVRGRSKAVERSPAIAGRSPVYHGRPFAVVCCLRSFAATPRLHFHHRWSRFPLGPQREREWGRNRRTQARKAHNL